MKKQVYKLGLVAFLGLSAMTFAQQDGTVGVNVDSPSATLEIQPSTTNKAEGARTNEGIIVPKLTKKRVANIENSKLVEGTLVYVTNKNYSGSNVKVKKITDKGFYYYDGNEWVKAGGGISGATLESLTGGIRSVEQATPAEWAKPGTFCLIHTTAATINMPNPALYPNKIFAVNNGYTTQVDYGGDYQPTYTALDAKKGHILMSDGTQWYVIGGSY